MNRPDLERALWGILDLLREYAGDLVLVGGWVPHLHLTYGHASGSTVRTSWTGEADLVVPSGLRRGERRPLIELLESAGFRPLGETKAVWGRDPEHGEKVEFFQQHRGPALSQGRAAPLAEQPGLSAVSLSYLWMLEEFTETLWVPAPEEGQPAPVRLPTLAAYVLNKANTFNLRSGPDGSGRSGKDLLYLRDIMAAGEWAENVLDEGFDAMLASALRGRVGSHLGRGLSHLDLAATRFVPHAARILAERDGLELAGARADIEGHLNDLADLLRVRAGEGAA